MLNAVVDIGRAAAREIVHYSNIEGLERRRQYLLDIGRGRVTPHMAAVEWSFLASNGSREAPRRTVL